GAASAAKLVGAAAALAAGGWLASRDVAATYLVTAGLCLLASLTAFALREAHVSTAGPAAAHLHGRARSIVAEMGAGFRAVLLHRPLLFAVLFSTLLFTLVRMAIYVHQPYLSAAGFDLTGVGV